MSRTMIRFISIIAGLVFLSCVSCVGAPPVDDYNIASTAINSARIAGASRFAAGYLARATDSYKLAQKLYEDRDYERARTAFRQAKLFAERAENLSALKRAQTGEVPE